MSVKVKFRVSMKDNGRVTFSPVTAGSPENEKVYSATPAGSIDLSMLAHEAFKQFEEGRCYFVEFTPAPIPGAAPTSSAPSKPK